MNHNVHLNRVVQLFSVASILVICLSFGCSNPPPKVEPTKQVSNIPPPPAGTIKLEPAKIPVVDVSQSAGNGNEAAKALAKLDGTDDNELAVINIKDLLNKVADEYRADIPRITRETISMHMTLEAGGISLPHVTILKGIHEFYKPDANTDFRVACSKFVETQTLAGKGDDPSRSMLSPTTIK